MSVGQWFFGELGMRRKKKLLEWKRLGLVLLGVAYGIADVVVLAFGLSEHAISSIFRVVMIGVAIYFCDKSLSEDRKGRDPWRAKFLRRNGRTVAAQVLRRFEDDAQDGPAEAGDGSLVMEPGWLAKQSYELFWDELLVRNREQKVNLTVLIVHATEIEVWQEHPKLLRMQRNFYDDGGSIERVICGNSPNPTDKVLASMKQMAEARVKVWYFYKNPANQISIPYKYDFSWDFAIVQGSFDVCVWDSNGGNTHDDTIKRAIYFRGNAYERTDDLMELFDRLKAASTEYVEAQGST